MRLSVGTAQLGMDYGVSNRRGRPSPERARELIRFAIESGIDSLDTAPAYGDSECVVGRSLPPDAEIRIITKTAAGGDSAATVAALEDSLRNLGLDSVYGLLVHDPAQLAGAPGAALAEGLVDARERGLVARLGVSIYERSDLVRAEALLPLEIVQLPLNVFDQRLLLDGTVDRLASAGVEVHARSIFLQGLLLMDPKALPAEVEGARGRLEELRERSDAAGLSPLQAALGFAARAPGLRSTIVGVNGTDELRECLAAAETGAGRIDYSAFAVDDPAVVDPRRWPAK